MLNIFINCFNLDSFGIWYNETEKKTTEKNPSIKRTKVSCYSVLQPLQTMDWYDISEEDEYWNFISLNFSSYRLMYCILAFQMRELSWCFYTFDGYNRY